MSFFKKFLIFFTIILSNILLANMLQTLDELQSSNVYLFEQNLIHKGQANRLICAYKEGEEVSIPFSDFTLSDIQELQRKNVSLVYYLPDFDVNGSSESPKNKKVQQQLTYLADCGMNAWVDVLGVNLFPVKPEDVHILNDVSTEKAWVDAISGLSEKDMRTLFSLARAWDIRLELLLEKRVIAWGNHFCEASGMRVVDNPIFGIWSFESNWLDRMLAGDWRELPEFFRKELHTEWNNWVYNEITKSTADFKAKYKFLVKGESVEEGTLRLVAMEQHPSINENDAWITLGDKTREIYQKTERYNLQREFFIQLYINHISNIKSKFLALGSVSRDAPYFITMSAKDNANMQLTDLYFGSQNTPYVYRYLGPSQQARLNSFAAAKTDIETNPELRNSSIIMMPYSAIKENTPYNYGFMNYAYTTHPKAMEELGIKATNLYCKEQECIFTFGTSETNYIDDIEFKVYDVAPNKIVTNVVNGVETISEQVPDNSNFELKLTYIKLERKRMDEDVNQIILFLDYNPSVAQHIYFQIFYKPLANYNLFADQRTEKHLICERKFNRRGVNKLPLYKNYRMLLIEEPSSDFLRH